MPRDNDHLARGNDSIMVGSRRGRQRIGWENRRSSQKSDARLEAFGAEEEVLGGTPQLAKVENKAAKEGTVIVES